MCRVCLCPHSAGWELLDDPLAVLPLADDGARDAQARELGNTNRAEAQQPRLFKPLVHARFSALRLATAGTLSPLRVSCLRDGHVSRLVALCGSVARRGPPTLRQAAASFSCSRCHHLFAVPLDAETGALATLPAACPSPRGCAGTRFVAAPPSSGALSPSLCCDSCELLVTLHSAEGAAGAGVTVILDADLTALPITPGTDICIFGVPRRRWNKAKGFGGRATAEIVLHAHAVVPLRTGPARLTRHVPGTPNPLDEFRVELQSAFPGQPYAARSALCASMCPSCTAWKVQSWACF